MLSQVILGLFYEKHVMSLEMLCLMMVYQITLMKYFSNFYFSLIGWGQIRGGTTIDPIKK